MNVNDNNKVSSRLYIYMISITIINTEFLSNIAPNHIDN